MPIKPENKARYPRDWQQIRARILSRAQNRCEQCGAPNRTMVMRDSTTYMLADGQVFEATTGEKLGLARGSEYPGTRSVLIVLTIAHLDHTPENCDESNLLAFCQRCHLAYDKTHHIANSRATRRHGKAAGELPGMGV
jgi:5-methylcytosine-specific restriction endonuclease McrA